MSDKKEGQYVKSLNNVINIVQILYKKNEFLQGEIKRIKADIREMKGSIQRQRR